MRMSSDARKPTAPAHPVGIKDIARALGISTGTVDRALHAKPGVSVMTRARVLSMAESLGYRPNLAARYLKSRKQLRISVHLPREIALFWDSLREGIRQAAAPFAPALHVDFRSYPSLGEGDIPLFDEALREGTNGLIVAPGNPAALKPYIRKAARKDIPVVCVITDAPDTPRLASVSADPFTVGAVAGELLARFQPAGGKVAFFTGWLSMQDHAEKLRGFESSLATTGAALKLGPVVEAHDDEREAHRRALAVLRAHPDLTSIYVSTVNSLPVLRAAEQEGRLPGLIVVTTDLFPELVERIRAGTIAATVYQRPLSQGRLALQALYQFLLNGACPSARIHVVPHLVMRSNLDVFLERLPVDLAVSPSSAAPDRPLSRRLDVTSQSPRGSLPRPRRPVGSRHRA
ncbi:MAG: LacI family transcriptional regulator [Acidobacteria bacterium]|nr:MAG: LacI family transcriptional regulator [Acidobacteriota bacterium]